jgi:hypothetical protein
MLFPFRVSVVQLCFLTKKNAYFLEDDLILLFCDAHTHSLPLEERAKQLVLEPEIHDTLEVDNTVDVNQPVEEAV